MGILVVGVVMIISAVVISTFGGPIDTGKQEVQGVYEEAQSSTPPSSEPTIEQNTKHATESSTPQPSAKPTIIPSPTNTPQPTQNPSPSSSHNVMDFKYSPSNIVSQSQTSLTLESDNSSDDITEWYEDKIKSSGFNVKTFVKTKSNGNVLNKLAGAKNDFKISIEITKESSNAKVKITVNLDSNSAYNLTLI